VVILSHVLATIIASSDESKINGLSLTISLLILDINNAVRYRIFVMIKSFADKDTERLWNRQHARSIPTDVQRRARRKLLMLNAAESLQDLRSPPGNRLEELRGDRKGQHSIRVNEQFRVCFVWKGSDAYELEVTDYR
jgi:proteic killer suppression protein